MREPIVRSQRNGISVIDPQVNIITPLTKERCKEIMDIIEFAGRTCYQSEPKGDPEKFITNLIERGHESVLEHCTVTIEFVTDRACYDAETKVLTDKGWKYFKDVDIDDDKILTITDDGRLEYITAIDKIDNIYHGPMDRYKSTQVDLLVTPNHNMWLYDYDKRSKNSRIWKFIKSEDVKNMRYIFNKSSYGTEVDNCTRFEIPSVTRKCGPFDKKFPGHIFTGLNVNLFLELLGLWVTDGSVSYGTNGSGNETFITQSKQSVRSRIENLLSILQIDYSKNDHGFRLNSPALFDWLCENFIDGKNTRKTYYLKLPRWMFEKLGRLNLDCFLRGVFLGDGSGFTRKPNDRRLIGNGIQICTASKAFAEDLIELALKTCRCANIRTVPPRDRTFPNGHVSHCREQYVVSIHSSVFHLFVNNDKHRFSEYYDGHVYCLTLPKHHRLYVMRNGKACWCGNCTHEMVRHRVAAYSQESTRYVKYDEGVYIHPIEFVGAYDRYAIWMYECIHSHEKYNELREMGCQKQEARSVLNNSLKTTIVVTYNMREWRHVLKLRCAKTAHPHIKEIMIPVLHYFKFKFPGMFDDIEYDEEFYKKYMSRLNTLLKETFITDKPIKKVPAEPKSEKKCDDCTKDKCDCHTESNESNESDEKNDKLVLTEGECTFNELDPRIKELMKFHGTPMVVEETYITQLKMKGTYKYTATNSIIVRELTGCSTSFRLQTFNYMDTDGGEVLPYSEVRDTVYLTAKITVLLGTPITGVCQMALKRFEQILIDHDRKDLIPYLSKISFKSEDIC